MGPILMLATVTLGTCAVYAAPLYDNYDPDYTSQLESSYSGNLNPYGENSSYESEQSNDSYSHGSEGYNPYGASSLKDDKLDDDDVKQIVKQVYEHGVDSLNTAP